MISKLSTITFNGIDVIEVLVQVSVASGQPSLIIVGLPDKTVNESKERIRVAMMSIGLSMPAKRIVVNLSPADVLKEGSHFDLPIALAILAAMDTLPSSLVANTISLGEIFLDGKIGGVNGVLPAAIYANETKKTILCSTENGEEAALAGSDLDIVAAPNLLSLLNHLKGNQLVARPDPLKISQDDSCFNYPDLLDIKGHEDAKRALKIAACGRHNMLMIGTPGTGKSMLASALIGILPPMNPKEILDTAIINSISGGLKGNKISHFRPYRAPHHSASTPAIVGGGKNVKPGEITLAHNGVLFLDELAEFQRTVLDSLRQPLESGQVTIARASAHVTYPARFQLISAMNPCKCGYAGEPSKQCSKVPKCVMEYQNHVSGPIMDRIDIKINVGNINPFQKTVNKTESSKEVLDVVIRTQEVQRQRCIAIGEMECYNSNLNGEMLNKFCLIDQETKDLINSYMAKSFLSMRGYTKILRVSRTIADIDNSESIGYHHVLEALSYRM